MSLAEVMTRSVVSVRPDAPVPTVAALLYNCAIGAVPVLGGDDRLLGVISGSELLRYSQERPRSTGPGPGGTSLAKDIMSRDVVAVPEALSEAEAAALMRRHHLRWLPVVEQQRVIGVITRSDLLRVLLPTDEVPALGALAEAGAGR